MSIPTSEGVRNERRTETVPKLRSECGEGMMYKFGDWVVYDNGYKQEIGRVTECRERSAFVCYSRGCTASSTPLEYLRPATDAEIAQAPERIGFHRFDETCPDYEEDFFCHTCRELANSREQIK